MGMFDKTYCADCGKKTDGTRLCENCNRSGALSLYSSEEFMRRLKIRMDHPYGCCMLCGRSLAEDGKCRCWERD